LTVNDRSCPKMPAMPAIDPTAPRIRLFKNKYLEQLTLISPRTFAVTWGVVLPFAVWTGWGSVGVPGGLGLFAAGLVTWTLCEYLLHRYLFHWDLDLPAVKWFVFLIHGNHHDSPNDPLRDLMPLSVSLPVAGLVWGLSVMALGDAGTWAFLGWITGYVLYDVVHYACHQWPMRGRLGAALKRHHMRHHYVDEGRNFGISSMIWDGVFGSRITSLKR
jgi:sterol desaturase/sphingolipid hydroxylase (fatty acid hydroxylase superfamily)